MEVPQVLFVGRGSVLDLLAGAARESNWHVAASPDVLAVPGAIAALHPDVVVLAVGVDDLEGIAPVCRWARESADVPVLVLLDSYDPTAYQAALAAGAEECITANHPIEIIQDLIRTALVGRGRLAAPAVEVGDLLIDEATHTVLRDGKRLELSPLEFDLLLALAHHPGVVVRKAELLNHLWTRYGAENSLEQAVSRLRRKLGGQCAVRNVRGIGYVLCSDGDGEVSVTG